MQLLYTALPQTRQEECARQSADLALREGPWCAGSQLRHSNLRDKLNFENGFPPPYSDFLTLSIGMGARDLRGSCYYFNACGSVGGGYVYGHGKFDAHAGFDSSIFLLVFVLDAQQLLSSWFSSGIGLWAEAAGLALFTLCLLLEVIVLIAVFIITAALVPAGTGWKCTAPLTSLCKGCLLRRGAFVHGGAVFLHCRAWAPITLDIGFWFLLPCLSIMALTGPDSIFPWRVVARIGPGVPLVSAWTRRCLGPSFDF